MSLYYTVGLEEGRLDYPSGVLLLHKELHK
jgi:hypothetical protein